MSEMVERVTQAIRAVQKRGPASHEMLARAAIAAMREPTEAMLEAIEQARVAGEYGDLSPYADVAPRDAWPIMIDAALKEPAGAEAPAASSH